MNRFPLQPRDKEGPVFNEPWEAQAFSMVIALHRQGLFTWDEWASVLGEEIRHAQGQGDPDLGNTYYQHWLSALENISVLKEFSSYSEMSARKNQWISAYEHTPHGRPIELSTAKNG